MVRRFRLFICCASCGSVDPCGDGHDDDLLLSRCVLGQNSGVLRANRPGYDDRLGKFRSILGVAGAVKQAARPPTEASDTMIELKNVSKWYGPFQVLTDCSTQVDKGDVVVICGPSGSGKSTLIKTVNGLEPFQQGE